MYDGFWLRLGFFIDGFYRELFLPYAQKEFFLVWRKVFPHGFSPRRKTLLIHFIQFYEIAVFTAAPGVETRSFISPATAALRHIIKYLIPFL